MRYSLYFTAILLLCSLSLLGQGKYEREFRIKRSEFPPNALALISEEISDARRIRYYKEIDSITSSFEAKFRKDKLHYSVEFSPRGELQDVEIRISEVDVPQEVYSTIITHLEKECAKYRVRKLQQQYPVTQDRPFGKVLKEAFQNLILPYIKYELIVSCKASSGRVEFEYLFDSEGSFISRRQSLPPNYDHILY